MPDFLSGIEAVHGIGRIAHDAGHKHGAAEDAQIMVVYVIIETGVPCHIRAGHRPEREGRAVRKDYPVPGD